MTIDPDAFDAFEAAGWELAARQYEHFFRELTSRSLEPLLDAAGVVAGMRVLDVATGPGNAAARAAGRGAEVVGLDVARAMVERARGNHPTLEFVQGSATDLPFAESSFDAVVGNFLILHLGEPERAASEFARVVSAEGRVALSTWDAPDRTRLLGVLLEAIADAGVTPSTDIPVGPSFFRFADEAEFTALLVGAGFDDVHVETLAFEHPLGSSDELFFGILEGTVRMAALLRAATDIERERVRKALEDRLAPYREDGGYAAPVSVKIGSAAKPR
jgi:ubiquinone/menaquinone biosynthesis C-methylase UbiE